MLACALAQPGLAARSAPSLAGPSAAKLKELERQAAESRARAAALAAKTAKIERDLRARRQALTDAAAEVRAGEEDLSRLEAEKASLSKAVQRRGAQLAVERAKLSRLTAGLVRLSRIPPGALFAGFDRPIDAARAALLLRSALAATRDSAQRMETELSQLDDDTRKLALKKQESEREADMLKTRQAKLSGLVDQRQALYEQTDSDRQAEEAKAKAIADQAQDLRDLVARIEAKQKAEQLAEAQRKAKTKSPSRSPAEFAVARGLPVAGSVKIHFGQNDGLGTTSHGVTVIARPGATVTAPAAGIVRFAGPFRGYREILILEHPGGYLSLIAGMSRINAPLGAHIGPGEPIGAMDARAEGSPELYYELRHDGQLVDPEAVALPVGVKGKAL